ncbi:hypothetical protein MNV49_001094 [Pseudohyphozyma bogoriensis]|nr:hypothetical protein MNV49_001094 [Pseudohyphozyma bogoriensis]
MGSVTRFRTTRPSLDESRPQLRPRHPRRSLSAPPIEEPPRPAPSPPPTTKLPSIPTFYVSSPPLTPPPSAPPSGTFLTVDDFAHLIAQKNLLAGTKPLSTPKNVTLSPISSTTPFKALLLASPSQSSRHIDFVKTLVKLDVGGTVLVTTAQTLIDGGGHLGEFVGKSLCFGDVKEEPFALSVYTETDDEDDLRDVLKELEACLAPSSPVDPLMTKSFLPLPIPTPCTSPTSSPTSPDTPYFSVLPGKSYTRPSLTYHRHDSTGFPTDATDVESLDDELSSFSPSPAPSPRVRRAPPPLHIPLATISSSDVARSDTPALSSSSSSDFPAERDTKPLETSTASTTTTLSIFLDRSSATYPSILSYLRTGFLSPSLTLATGTPLSPGAPSIDETALRVFRLAPSTIGKIVRGLREVKVEAEWLGLNGLVAACEGELKKAEEVVKWLDEERKRGGGRGARKAKREKDGWLEGQWM